MPASCNQPRSPSSQPCNIQAEIKNRTGHHRWWCDVHGAPAWGVAGERLSACAGHTTGSQGDDLARLDLRLEDYPGGVGIWGALDPVYSTSTATTERGIHVHARADIGGEKQIDGTFHEVLVVAADGGSVLVDAPSAMAAVVAMVFGLALKELRCPRCKEVHLDLEHFAVTPHLKHQCNRCGRPFFDPQRQRSISNPAAALLDLVRTSGRCTVPAKERLAVRRRDYSDISVWGSNPALLWTSPLPEEEGLHVHARDRLGRSVIDDTYASVEIDGVPLDATQLRVVMVQRSLRHLDGRVVPLTCQRCGLPHFDNGVAALQPTTVHRCAGCGDILAVRGRNRRVVANPIVAELDRLARMTP